MSASDKSEQPQRRHHAKFCPWARRSNNLSHLIIREKQVLTLVLQGYGRSGIAKELKINPNTVKVYLRRAGDKLGIAKEIPNRHLDSAQKAFDLQLISFSKSVEP